MTAIQRGHSHSEICKLITKSDLIRITLDLLDIGTPNKRDLIWGLIWSESGSNTSYLSSTNSVRFLLRLFYPKHLVVASFRWENTRALASSHVQSPQKQPSVAAFTADWHPNIRLSSRLIAARWL